MRCASKDDVPEEDWREALRREAVIRPLAGRPRLTIAAVDGAAAELGLKRARVYRLIAGDHRLPLGAAGERPGMELIVLGERRVAREPRPPRGAAPAPPRPAGASGARR